MDREFFARMRFALARGSRLNGFFVLLVMNMGGLAWGQNPLSPGYTPAQLSTQLPAPLFVRVAGPPGMKVTLYRGQAQGNTLEAPFVVGLRPGYTYRLAVTGLKNFPLQVYYPTLEVRGSLYLGGNLKTRDYPAGLVFAEEDFLRVQSGALVKKVILLEKPDNALAEASLPGNSLEVTTPPNRDPLFEARDRGLPLVILHLGQRQVSEEELAESGISGTVLLPGEQALGTPRRLPWMPWACYPVYDPILGAAPPWPYYSLPDGGDTGVQAGYTSQGRLAGLDPSDTVAEYEDSKGNRRVAISNRVRLCVPRFIVVKGEMNLGNQVAALGPEGTQGTQGRQAFNGSQSLQGQRQHQFVEAARDRQKPSGADNLFGTSVTGKVQGLEVKANLSIPGVVNSTKMPPTALEPPDRPLKIIKWPDKSGGLVGDVITFYLKISNQGGQPIANVVVSDSLITRYEYIPGSARADREASFTTQPNEAGSVILRWEFPGTLLPHESSLVSFQVKIR
jgi:uncharacterized repeat protein (TIGR01451 family)